MYIKESTRGTITHIQESEEEKERKKQAKCN